MMCLQRGLHAGAEGMPHACNHCRLLHVPLRLKETPAKGNTVAVAQTSGKAPETTVAHDTTGAGSCRPHPHISPLPTARRGPVAHLHVPRLSSRRTLETTSARSTQHEPHGKGQPLMWQSSRHARGHENRYSRCVETGPLEDMV